MHLKWFVLVWNARRENKTPTTGKYITDAKICSHMQPVNARNRKGRSVDAGHCFGVCMFLHGNGKRRQRFTFIQISSVQKPNQTKQKNKNKYMINPNIERMNERQSKHAYDKFTHFSANLHTQREREKLRTRTRCKVQCSNSRC